MSSEQSSHRNENRQMNLSTNTNTGDIHICGTCKINFSDLNMFMEHKRSQCLGPPPDTVHSQPLLELVTTNSTDDSMGLSLVGLHPLYRINMDNDNLTAQQETRLILHHLRSQGISGSVILRSRLLESNSERPVETSVDSPNSASSMQEMISMQHQQSRRDFEMDEEDVATLLANQLANEVVRGVNQSSVSTFGGELLSRASISQNRDTGSPETTNLFSSENVGIQKESAGTHSDPDESFNSPLPPQEEFILPDDELVQGNLDCQPDTTDTQEVSVAQAPSRLKKRHCCDIEDCGFASFYLKDLARHMRKHTGERPFRCTVCSKSFSRADKLQVHQRIHAGIKSHTCAICPYATGDSSTLRKHMLIHTGERPYKCQICSYRSRTTSHLTVHLRTHTGDCPFVCPAESCPAAFKTSSDLRRHSRLHSGEKPYECDVCEYTCNIKSNLKIHIRLNHIQYTPVPCSTCHYLPTSKRAAREHRKLHAGDILKCGVCPYACTDRGLMETHREFHRTLPTKGVSCKHCFYTSLHKKNLKRHLRSKHPNVLLRKSRKNDSDGTSHVKGNVQDNYQKVSSKPFCNKTHQCTICNIAFVREDSWRSHLRQHKGLGSVAERPTELSARDLLEIAEKERSARELKDMDETAEATSRIEEAAVPDEPPPQSVYVYVTEGGGGADLPVVFSMLSAPLDSPVAFAHRHTDSLLHDIRNDVRPSEPHATETVIKKF